MLNAQSVANATKNSGLAATLKTANGHIGLLNQWIPFALTNQGMHAGNGNTEFSGSTTMPYVEEYGVRMVPTQVPVVSASEDLNTYYDPLATDPRMWSQFELRLGTRGAVRLDERVTVYDGVSMIPHVEPVLDEFYLCSRVRPQEFQITPTYSRKGLRSEPLSGSTAYLDVQSAFSHVEMRESMSAVGGTRGVGYNFAVGGFVNRELSMFKLHTHRGLANGKSRYLRFYVQAWLDFFSQGWTDGNVNPAPELGLVDVYFQNAHPATAFAGGPHGVAANLVPRMFGGEEMYWDEQRANGPNYNDVANHTTFFLDMVEGYDEHFIKWVTATAQTRLRLSGRVHVSNHDEYALAREVSTFGVTSVMVHLGDKMMPTIDNAFAAKWQAGRPECSLDIYRMSSYTQMGYMHRFAAKTNSASDMMKAFEIVNTLVVGFYSRNLHTTANETGIVNTGGQTVRATLTNVMSLPHDETLQEYYKPFYVNRPDVTSLTPFLDIRKDEIWFLTLLNAYHNALALGWAYKVCSITKSCVESYELNSGNERQAHYERMMARPAPEDFSTFDSAYTNAMAWISGHKPTTWLILGQQHRRGVGFDIGRSVWNFKRSHHFGVFCMPVHLMWSVKSLPDFYMLPTPGAVVKWPEGGAYPMRNNLEAVRDVRLSNTWAPDSCPLWVQDGGAEYSAQFYHACNARDDYRGRQGNEGAHVFFNGWDKPREYNHPRDPNIVPISNWRGLGGMFILPGQMSTYNSETRNTRAFGASADRGSYPHTQVMQQVPNVTPTIAFPHIIARKTEGTPIVNWHLGVLISEDGEYKGSVVVKQQDVAMWNPEPETWQRATSGQGQYKMGKQLGPSAIPNDNNTGFGETPTSAQYTPAPFGYTFPTRPTRNTTKRSTSLRKAHDGVVTAALNNQLNDATARAERERQSLQDAMDRVNKHNDTLSGYRVKETNNVSWSDLLEEKRAKVQRQKVEAPRDSPVASITPLKSAMKSRPGDKRKSKKEGKPTTSANQPPAAETIADVINAEVTSAAKGFKVFGKKGPLSGKGRKELAMITNKLLGRKSTAKITRDDQQEIFEKIQELGHTLVNNPLQYGDASELSKDMQNYSKLVEGYKLEGLFKEIPDLPTPNDINSVLAENLLAMDKHGDLEVKHSDDPYNESFMERARLEVFDAFKEAYTEGESEADDDDHLN